MEECQIQTGCIFQISIKTITRLQLNSEVTATMKRAVSKSTIKKSKGIITVPESKKNSRVTKTHSCIKISSQNTEQPSSNNTLTLNPPLSKSQLHNLSHKMLAPPNTANPATVTNHPHFIDKPQSQRFSSRNHIKSTVQSIPTRQLPPLEQAQIRHINEHLTKQNISLKQKCCQLQEMSLRDKEKIKNLIIRINQVKNQHQPQSQAKTLHPSTAKLPTSLDHGQSYSLLPHKNKLQTPYKGITHHCDNHDCIERKKYLQGQLYRQRIQRDKLQLQKRQWEKNRQSLKQQYNNLLEEIREMRECQF